jgi:ABC-type antimicrobial peptide transport system permease subunit
MSLINDIDPPKWPLKILGVLIRREYLEEIEGDMEEEFRDNIDRIGVRKARRVYTWEAVKLLRPVLLKNFKYFKRMNRIAMLSNYFKVSFRGLLKTPVNSFTNVFGLAMAIGVCVLAYGYSRMVFTTDQFHEHKNEVFMVTFKANRDGTLQEYGITPRPLGEMIKQDFAAARKVCRVEDRGVVVKVDDNVFHERIRYTDPSFLDMFTFPLKWGTPSTLSDVNSIILSEEMSVKYFGEENPIGKTILVKFNEQTGKEFKVTGVAAKFPDAITITFSFLINFENLRTDRYYDFHAWDKTVNATLVQVDHPSDIVSIQAGMDKYKKLVNEVVSDDWAIASFGFQPLATLYERGDSIKEDISRNSDSNFKAIIFLVTVAVFLLVLACFNYINIAIVSATKRLKEIGIRKSIGATRKVVIAQFLVENLLVTFFALVVGFLFGAFVVIPWFERMNSFTMGFELVDLDLWLYLAGILLVTSIASGMYPSLYISKFQVVSILKGAVQFGRKNPVTRILLGFQLVLACAFVTCAVTFSMNSIYLTERSWGYNQHETIYVPVANQAHFEQLSAAVESDPHVVSMSGSQHHLGKGHSSVVMHFPDREFEADVVAVDANYLSTMEIPLREGRGFIDHENSDRQSVIVNRMLVTNMGWTQAIGQTFRIDSTRFEVIGVTEDFHSYSFTRLVRPMMFKVADKPDYRFLSVRVTPGKEMDVLKSVETKWSALFPDTPFSGGFQEDVWGYYQQFIGNHGRVWRSLAVVALILAGMGLYGLLSLNVSARVKEFSIRKILGAGVANITSHIGKQYLLLLTISLAIGAPASFFLNKFVMDVAYRYHIPVTWTIVVYGVAILLTLVLATFATQIVKAWKVNAVEGLKTE